MCVCVCVCAYIYQPLRTSRISRKVSFLKRIYTILNLEFSFSKSDCNLKVKILFTIYPLVENK